MTATGSGTVGARCDGFLRHIRACHNTSLPGGRVPFRLGGTPVGWLAADFAPEVCAAAGTLVTSASDGITLHAPGELPGLARRLADRGAIGWRGEAFDVRATADGPPLAQIDRGALPTFGLLGIGVHLNGLVRRADGLWIWVARRAADKALDPGKLDHLVGGGVPAGLTPRETLIKEAAEEAALPAALAAGAIEVARLGYTMQRHEGLRRDALICYDLELTEDFHPLPTDGEVESFQLWPIAAAAEAVRDTDDFKFNVNLVLIDLFLRAGVIDPASTEGSLLRAELSAG